MTRFFRSPSVLIAVSLLLLSFNLLIPSAPVEAAIPGLAGGYFQNFDTLANTGTSNTWVNEEAGTPTLSGWYAYANGSPTGQYRTSTSPASGSLYSFGSSGSTERALGSLASPSTGTLHYGLQLTNNTEETINSLYIEYRGEQWFSGSNASEHRLIFEYQVDAPGFLTGVWTPFVPLDFVSPITGATTGSAIDGNDFLNSYTPNGVIPVEIPPDSSLWIRWADINDDENDHGLAIDDLVVTVGGTVVTPSATPVPPTSTPTPITGTPVSPTPGPSPTNTPELPCTAPDRIYELQEGGSKHNPSATPSASRTVAGVVVGDYQTGLDGFYIQDETGDGNAATSDGIFVYDPAPLLLDVTVGQRVIVTGSTSEFSGETQITAQSVTTCGGSVNLTPVTVALPISSLSLYENYEGMLVTIVDASTGPLTVSETFTLARFGEIVVSSGGRLFQPTSYAAPGSAALAAQELNDRRRIVIDDGQNGTPANGAVPYIPTTETEFRLGFTTPSITGILEYGFNVYRIQPTTSIIWTTSNPRPLTPPAVAESDVRAATLNLLNFFNGDGAGGGFPTSRGANTPQEFTRQRPKTVAAIVGLNVDILALNELENDDTAAQYSAVEELVDSINAVAGANTYTFIDTGIVGTDQIRVGILYKPAVVQPVGGFSLLSTPPFSDSRPSLAQLFEHVGSGERFYVVANHFKSKGCGGAAGADQDQGDGQGCYNATRVQMSQLLADWIAIDAYFDADHDVLILGDLNSYAMENPISTLKSLGYTNLIEKFASTGEIPYSYVFSGQSGTLDYAFANTTFLPQIVGAADWHINADEPIGRDYNDDVITSGEFSADFRQPYLYQPNGFRVSDHDPLVVSIRFDGPLLTETPPSSTGTSVPASSTPNTEVTPTATQAANQTATPTGTVVAGVDLIVNGGFELKVNGEPQLDPWKLKNGSRDKIICDKSPSIAFEGHCAFRFKGGLFENAKLSQAIDLTSFIPQAGDTIRFGIRYHLPKPENRLEVKTVVKYIDPQQLPGMVKQTLAQTAGYQHFTGEITFTGAALKAVDVRLSHKSTKGKAYIDAVKLEVLSAAPLISLP
jgi:predicted extracellular nuclease